MGVSVSPNAESPLTSEKGSQTPKIKVIGFFIDKGSRDQCKVKGYRYIGYTLHKIKSEAES